jgi:hypothetical protein
MGVQFRPDASNVIGSMEVIAASTRSALAFQRRS